MVTSFVYDSKRVKLGHKDAGQTIRSVLASVDSALQRSRSGFSVAGGAARSKLETPRCSILPNRRPSNVYVQLKFLPHCRVCEWDQQRIVFLDQQLLTRCFPLLQRIT
jgi:hypothetical protein